MLEPKELIEEAVQASIDAGLAVNGEHGVAAARHAARFMFNALQAATRPAVTDTPAIKEFRRIFHTTRFTLDIRYQPELIANVLSDIDTLSAHPCTTSPVVDHETANVDGKPNAVTDAMVLAAVRAHDAEDAAQKGEPDPWADDFPEPYLSERMFSMRLALAAALGAAGEPVAWQPIETAPKDRPFLAAEWDGKGWIVGVCVWCKTPHVPFYGFHFTEGDPEDWNMAHPTLWMEKPFPPLSAAPQGASHDE